MPCAEHTSDKLSNVTGFHLFCCLTNSLGGGGEDLAVPESGQSAPGLVGSRWLVQPCSYRQLGQGSDSSFVSHWAWPGLRCLTAVAFSQPRPLPFPHLLGIPGWMNEQQRPCGHLNHAKKWVSSGDCASPLSPNLSC